MMFEHERHIRFSQCDPAGIVFYPQYFVMFNDLMEAWVDHGLGIGFEDLIARRRIGMPTVRLEADFRAISRMGDRVILSLAVERIGARSLGLTLSCKGMDGELRMAVRQVIVTTSLDTHKAVPLPADMRAALGRFILPPAAKEAPME